MNTQPIQSNSREFWEHHINQWKESSMSQASYCRQNGLKWHDFYYWKNKVRRKEPSYTRMEELLDISAANLNRATSK